MECNKEEAIRAKEIAEKKMQSSDFVGARKIGLKAQQLFPELENLSQLLTVCDVHCSAQNKVGGSEMDWYGILQVERMADESTIKKQYRKLALLLHPDKNKFVGAEAAFKLIGEANRVLCDQAKRSMYDMKIRVPVRNSAPRAPPHQVNRNSYVRKQYGAPDVTNTQFMGSHVHQQAQTMFSNDRQTFWTSCPFCDIRYQYYRDIVNKSLRCQSCSKPFVAYDLGAQGMPGSSWSQPAFSHQKQVPSQGPFNVSSQNNWGKPMSGMGVQQSYGSKSGGSEPFLKTGRTADVGGASKCKSREGDRVDVRDGKEGVSVPKSGAAKPGESGASKTSRNTGSKRGRKVVVESSESFETESSVEAEDDIIQENGGDATVQNSGLKEGGHPRRSSRQKRFVYYNENASDDDDFVFVSRPKRSKQSGLSMPGEEEVKQDPLDDELSKHNHSTGFSAVADEGKEEFKEKGSNPLGQSLPNRESKATECKVNGEAAMDYDDEDSNVDDNSESQPGFYQSPDPEFSDFDKCKADGCFAVDQLWAIYDTVDGMPRFYARVRRVFSPGFKLRITWLEPKPDGQDEIDWVNKDLPVGCCEYGHGKSLITTDRLMFSHQVQSGKSSGRCSYVIYPRKGETWALFKNWDIRWSSIPEHHGNFKFEIVEVLSDFNDNDGIVVAYLDKIKGFVSLFQKTRREGIVSFKIPSKERFRFSHQIPSVRMTGAERGGVPVGSLELDPAALPADLNEFELDRDVKMESKVLDSKLSGSCSKSHENEAKQRMCSESIKTSHKSVDLQEKNDLGGENLKLRRSPRDFNGNTPKKSMNSQEKINFDLDDSKPEASERERNDGISKKSMDLQEKNDFAREASKLRRSPRDLNKSHNKDGQASVGCCRAQAVTNDCVDGATERRHLNCGQREGNASCRASCRIDEKIHVCVSDPNSFTKKPGVPLSLFSGFNIPEAGFHDFSVDKSKEKFQPGQVWALYSVKDGLPKNYGQIRGIESAPVFRLHVALLEPCLLSRDMILPVCCGVFKSKSSKLETFLPADFSHRLKAEPISKTKFEIYPRKDEIWALYKNWSTESTCSNVEDCKYEIVVVLDEDGHNTKVLSLVRQNGFRSVFKAPRRQRSTYMMEIPRIELFRFSHQIPAFALTEKDGCSCWELDPASIPGTLSSLN